MFVVLNHSHRFYDVLWELIMDASSFQGLTAILDYVTHLASMSCWYSSYSRRDEFKLLKCEFQKYKVMTMSVVGGQPKQHVNTSYKATKHIKHTFLISDWVPYLPVCNVHFFSTEKAPKIEMCIIHGILCFASLISM